MWFLVAWLALGLVLLCSTVLVGLMSLFGQALSEEPLSGEQSLLEESSGRKSGLILARSLLDQEELLSGEALSSSQERSSSCCSSSLPEARRQL
jgi:hypothetical protein